MPITRWSVLAGILVLSAGFEAWAYDVPAGDLPAMAGEPRAGVSPTLWNDAIEPCNEATLPPSVGALSGDEAALRGQICQLLHQTSGPLSPALNTLVRDTSSAIGSAHPNDEEIARLSRELLDAANAANAITVRGAIPARAADRAANRSFLAMLGAPTGPRCPPRALSSFPTPAAGRLYGDRCARGAQTSDCTCDDPSSVMPNFEGMFAQDKKFDEYVQNLLLPGLRRSMTGIDAWTRAQTAARTPPFTGLEIRAMDPELGAQGANGYAAPERQADGTYKMVIFLNPDVDPVEAMSVIAHESHHVSTMVTAETSGTNPGPIARAYEAQETRRRVRQEYGEVYDTYKTMADDWRRMCFSQPGNPLFMRGSCAGRECQPGCCISGAWQGSPSSDPPDTPSPPPASASLCMADDGNPMTLGGGSLDVRAPEPCADRTPAPYWNCRSAARTAVTGETTRFRDSVEANCARVNQTLQTYGRTERVCGTSGATAEQKSREMEDLLDPENAAGLASMIPTAPARTWPAARRNSEVRQVGELRSSIVQSRGEFHAAKARASYLDGRGDIPFGEVYGMTLGGLTWPHVSRIVEDAEREYTAASTLIARHNVIDEYPAHAISWQVMAELGSEVPGVCGRVSTHTGSGEVRSMGATYRREREDFLCGRYLCKNIAVPYTAHMSEHGSGIDRSRIFVGTSNNINMTANMTNELRCYDGWRTGDYSTCASVGMSNRVVSPPVALDAAVFASCPGSPTTAPTVETDCTPYAGGHSAGDGHAH